MNLWRVPVDEDSGRTLGAPEAVTVPAEWSGFPSLTRDGKSILFAITESKANLERVALDARQTAGSALEPVTQGSRGVRSCDVSPDGRWVAFHSSIPQEDLFVVRPDGSGLRQITNDAARDRFPRWSPDGSRLAFQSDRGGTYEIWTLRPDGSGMDRATPPDGNPAYPVWSPDGRTLALTLINQGSALVDLSQPLTRRKLAAIPPAYGRLRFYPSSWSPDGRWIAGGADEMDGRSAPGIFLYSPETQGYRTLTGEANVPRWMPDGRSLLAFGSERRQRIVAVDARSGAVREVLSARPNSSFIAHCVSPDGRTLFVSQGSDEGDIGMLTLQ
jgi:Tol biopolymer transport system component